MNYLMKIRKYLLQLKISKLMITAIINYIWSNVGDKLKMDLPASLLYWITIGLGIATDIAIIKCLI